MRLSEFGELLGRRQALDRRRQHGVCVGVAIGRAIRLRQRQRSAQFEAARFLRLRDSDRVSMRSELPHPIENRVRLSERIGQFMN